MNHLRTVSYGIVYEKTEKGLSPYVNVSQTVESVSAELNKKNDIELVPQFSIVEMRVHPDFLTQMSEFYAKAAKELEELNSKLKSSVEEEKAE